jgi:hypothetical protein
MRTLATLYRILVWITKNSINIYNGNDTYIVKISKKDPIYFISVFRTLSTPPAIANRSKAFFCRSERERGKGGGRYGCVSWRLGFGDEDIFNQKKA